MLGALIQAFLFSSYKGNFLEDFAVFLTTDLRLIIAQQGDAELDEEIKDQLKSMSEDLGFEVFYAKSINFKGMENDECESALNEALSEIFEGKVVRVDISANRAFIDIVVEGPLKDSKTGKGVLKELSSVDGLNNFRVLFKDGEYVSISGTTEADKSVHKLQTGRPNRDTVISNNDICDLKIALGTCNSVEEFLAMM